MAGAQTAVASDSTALWANPAGLGVEPKLDLDLFGSALAADRGRFVSSLNALTALDPALVAVGNPAQLQAAVATLHNLAGPGVGAIGSGVAGLVVAERGLAIGVGEVAYAGVYPNIDLVHILPGTDPNTSFRFNGTGVNAVGLEAREVRVGYAYGLYGRTILVGAAVRYIWGRTYYNHTSIFEVGQDNVGAVIVDAVKKNEKTTSRFTFDAGAIVNIISTVRVGIVSTSMTEPKFDVTQSAVDPALLGAPAYVRLPRTVRAGAAVTPLSALTVAVDYDLVPSNTLIPGGKSRQFSAGVEVNVPLFAIRAGTWHDFEAPDPHWSYSAGLGLKLLMLSINASVMLSQEGGLSLTSPKRRDVGAAVDAHFRF
jgi:hypothetical protein